MSEIIFADLNSKFFDLNLPKFVKLLSYCAHRKKIKGSVIFYLENTFEVTNKTTGESEN